jgi:TolA-binding protein
MKILKVLAYLTLALSLSSCLKTRAELRGDTPDSEPAPAQAAPRANSVQDVQPQGSYAIDEIKQQMTTLQGRIEDLERAQKDTKKDSSAQDNEKKLEQRVGELETAQTNMLEAMKKMQEDGVAEDPSEIYNKGKAEFDAENWDGAIEDLNKFFKNPKAKEDKKDLEDATFYRA